MALLDFSSVLLAPSVFGNGQRKNLVTLSPGGFLFRDERDLVEQQTKASDGQKVLHQRCSATGLFPSLTFLVTSAWHRSPLILSFSSFVSNDMVQLRCENQEKGRSSSRDFASARTNVKMRFRTALFFARANLSADSTHTIFLVFLLAEK